jgi:hypothetical protein
MRLPAEIQGGRLGHLVRARLIGRRIRCPITVLDQFVRHQICLNLFAAYVGQHVPVHFNTRAQHLTALLDHLLALERIIDDVPIFKRQIVFAQNSADPLAPAASRFQVSDYFRFIHSLNLLQPAISPQNAKPKATGLTTDKTPIGEAREPCECGRLTWRPGFENPCLSVFIGGFPFAGLEELALLYG